MNVNPPLLKVILERLEVIDQHILNLQKSQLDHLIEESEFRRIMRISSRTAKYWRQKGMIPYVKIGYRILYRQIDIQALLDRHYRHASQPFKTK